MFVHSCQDRIGWKEAAGKSAFLSHSMVSLVTCLSCRGEDNEGGKGKSLKAECFLVALKSKYHYFLDYNKIYVYIIYMHA